MAELLVSVRSAAEARVASQAGCRWIDVKEPTRGALGRADESVWREVADVLAEDASSAHLTIALGDVRDPIPDRIAVPEAVTAVKLAPGPRPRGMAWDEHLQTLRRRWEAAAGRALPWAGVGYVDEHGDDLSELIVASKQLGDAYFLFDTGDKSGPSAVDQLDRLPPTPGMTVCLAGRLRRDQLAAAAELGADIVGVRSAVCDGDRTGSLVASAIHKCRDAMRLMSA